MYHAKLFSVHWLDPQFILEEDVVRIPSVVSSFIIVTCAVITGIVVYHATGLLAIGMMTTMALTFASDIVSFIKKALKKSFRRSRNRRHE